MNRIPSLFAALALFAPTAALAHGSGDAHEEPAKEPAEEAEAMPEAEEAPEAAPEDAFRGQVTDVADKGIRGAYVCAKSTDKEVCAMSDENGRIELPVMTGALSIEVVASTLGPVKLTLQRAARTNTVQCEKTFTSGQGQHAVVTCSFDG